MLRAARTARPLMLLAVAAAASLLLAGCGESATDETTRDDSGAVASAGTLGVEKLRVGDCLDVGDLSTKAEGEVEAFTGVPCTEPHQAEVFLVDKAFYADQPETYPGEAAIGEAADDGCFEAFEGYTGKPFTEDSEIEWVSITPTAETWIDNDRTLVCALVTPTADGNDLEKTTGSLKG